MPEQPSLFDTDTSAEIERLRADLAADRSELTLLGDLLHGYRRRESEAYREQYATAKRTAWQAVTGAARPPYVTGPTELTAAAEIRWLRDYIDRAGRRLHAEYGDPSPPVADRCHCVGCDLIVGTDLEDRPETAELPARDTMQRRLIEAETELEQARQAKAFQDAKSAELDARVSRLAQERDEALRDATRIGLRRVHEHLESFASVQVSGVQRQEGAQVVIDHVAELAGTGGTSPLDHLEETHD